MMQYEGSKLRPVPCDLMLLFSAKNPGNYVNNRVCDQVEEGGQKAYFHGSSNFDRKLTVIVRFCTFFVCLCQLAFDDADATEVT